MSKQPNILLVTADGMRYDALRCNDNPLAQSPRLDELAQEGVNFQRAYCSQPICMPCRATIMTGRYPSAHGVWQNGITLDPEVPNLASGLKQAGYHTACYGKCHFRPWLPSLEPNELNHQPEFLEHGHYYGFDHVRVTDHSHEDEYYQWVEQNHPQWLELARNPASECPPDAKLAWKTKMPREATKSQYIADLTIDALKQQTTDKPFFVWASFIDPHHPYNPPAPYCDMFDVAAFDPPPSNQGPSKQLPEHYHTWAKRLADHWGHVDTAQKQWLNLRRMYQGKVAHVDYQIGRLFDTLKEQGQWDNTIIVYLSDHGTMLGDYGLVQVGEYSQESLVHIPMIWRLPGGSGGSGSGGGGSKQGQISQALVSTVDIMPSLLDLAGVESPLGVQGESLRPILENPSQTVRDQVLIENRYGQSPPEGFRTLVTDRYKLSVCSNGREGELYDLHNDPQELTNLFGQPQVAEIQAQLMHQFGVEMLRQIDPLPQREACW